MKNKTKTLTNEKLSEIEGRLADIITEFGHLKGQSPKVTKVLAHIYINGELTQQQLRERTGYSLGTISTALQNIEKTKFICKNRVPKSRQYNYKINGTLPTILSQSMTEFPVYLAQMGDFLLKVEKKLNSPSLINQQGYTNIKQFLDEMNIIIPAYETILQKFQTKNPLAEKREGQCK